MSCESDLFLCLESIKDDFGIPCLGRCSQGYSFFKYSGFELRFYVCNGGDCKPVCQGEGLFCVYVDPHRCCDYRFLKDVTDSAFHVYFR